MCSLWEICFWHYGHLRSGRCGPFQQITVSSLVSKCPKSISEWRMLHFRVAASSEWARICVRAWTSDPAWARQLFGPQVAVAMEVAMEAYRSCGEQTAMATLLMAEHFLRVQRSAVTSSINSQFLVNGWKLQVLRIVKCAVVTSECTTIPTTFNIYIDVHL